MEDNPFDLTDLDPEEMLAQLDEHAQSIGHVAIGWNSAQAVVFLIFCQLSKMPFECSRAIFFALTADVQQRAITMELARAALYDDADTSRKVIAAIDKLNKLSSERNAVIHSMWSMPNREKRIGLLENSKIFHKEYEEDPAESMKKLDEKIAYAHDTLVKVFRLILQHDASKSKQLD